jgi:hypothetical protein
MCLCVKSCDFVMLDNCHDNSSINSLLTMCNLSSKAAGKKE